MKLFGWLSLVVMLATIRGSLQCSEVNMETITECVETMNDDIASEIESISGDFANAGDYCTNIATDVSIAEACLAAVTSADCNAYRNDYENIVRSMTYKITQVCECDNVGAKLTALDDCISDLSPPEDGNYNYDNVCSYVREYSECLQATVEQCDAMRYVARFGDLKAATDLYDCHIQLNDGFYQTQKCSYLNMTKCYNDLITQHISWSSDFSKDTNWADYWSFSVSLVTDAGTYCTALWNVWESMYDCGKEEFKKCDVAAFKAYGDEMTSAGTYWGSWRSDTSDDATDLSSLSTGLFDRLNSLYTLTGPAIASNLQRAGGLMKLSCDLSCENYDARLSNYDSCLDTALAGDYEDIRELMQVIGDKFSNEESYSSECSVLQSVRACANSYYRGCPWTEAIYALSDSDVANYGVADICNAVVSFDSHGWPGFCDNSQFVQGETPYAINICWGSTLTSEDIIDLDLATDDDVCEAFEEQIRCYLQNAKCCSTRENVIAPRRHTWAMINQLFEGDCGLLMKKDNDPDYTQATYLLKPLDSDCNYMEVLECYQPLLDVVELDASDLSTISRSELASILAIVVTIQSDMNQCPSEDDFDNMKECTESFVNQCKFPKLCHGDDEEETMPLADLFYTDAYYLCSEYCESTPEIERQLLSCNSEGLKLWSLDAITNEMLNEDSEMDCSKISNFSDCYVQMAAECDVKIDYFYNEEVGVETVRHDAAQRCDVDLGQTKLSGSPGVSPGFIMTLCGFLAWNFFSRIYGDVKVPLLQENFGPMS